MHNAKNGIEPGIHACWNCKQKIKLRVAASFFGNKMLVATRMVFLLLAILGANTFANAQSLTTNPPGNYEVSSSGASVNIGATVTIGTGSTTLTAATVSIAGNYNSGDILKINNSTNGSDSGLNFLFNAGSGILSITGTATEAIYQSVLRKVTFNTSSTNTNARTITFSLNAAVPYSGNGHYYEYISGTTLTWTQAKNAAAGKTYFGLKGYLVTVTSAGEQAFVSDKLGGATGWLGASDAASEANWKWVTGPEAGTQFSNWATPVNNQYTNWNSGEPNNVGAGEHYGQFVVTTGKWNDLPDAGGVDGYVVEYGGSTGDPAVQISDDVTIEVVINPTGVSATATTICQGSSTTLTAQGAQGTVHWYTGSCGGSEVETGNSIAVSPLETTTYYARNEVDDTYSNGCASITIIVNPFLQYRSKQSGSWTTATNWEQYNGTAWGNATSYPGQVSSGCGTPLVTVRANHTMAIPSGMINIPNLTIETNGVVEKDIAASLIITSELIMAEDANGGIQIKHTVD